METWHVLVMGDGVAANPISQQIMDAFDPVYIALGQPAACAVFSVYDLKRNLVSAYFTPEAAQLAAMFRATPCDKPSQDGRLGLLVGRDDARDKYFGK